MKETRFVLSIIAAIAFAVPASAERYWLASEKVKNTTPSNAQGYANTLTLTSDDPADPVDPIVLQDLRQDDTNSRRLIKYARGNGDAPFPGCGYGGADLDLTLPIRDAAGNEFTLVRLVNEAFQDNNYIRSIKFPSSLEEIGQYAFRRAYYLKSAEFPADTSAIKSLGAQIFDSCTRLEGYFVWPSQITELGNYSFYNTNISGFYGPSVTKVGNVAFNGCKALKTLEFGDSVEFGSAVFQNTGGAAYNVMFHDAPPVLDSNNYLIGGSNGVFDWWNLKNANATVYIPLNAAKDGPTDNWVAFKTAFEAAVKDDLITWPTYNGDGTWTDGSIYAAAPKSTVRLRFWNPDDTTDESLLVY